MRSPARPVAKTSRAGVSAPAPTCYHRADTSLGFPCEAREARHPGRVWFRTAVRTMAATPLDECHRDLGCGGVCLRSPPRDDRGQDDAGSRGPFRRRGATVFSRLDSLSRVRALATTGWGLAASNQAPRDCDHRRRYPLRAEHAAEGGRYDRDCRLARRGGSSRDRFSLARVIYRRARARSSAPPSGPEWFGPSLRFSGRLP